MTASFSAKNRGHIRQQKHPCPKHSLLSRDPRALVGTSSPLRYAQELERPIVAFTLTGSSHDTMHTLPANLILPCLRADGPDIS